MTRSDLPRRVYLRHGRYYWVHPVTAKWVPLTREAEGLPAMYRALAAVTDANSTRDLMPAVITRWLDEKAADWEPKTKTDMERVAARLAKRFQQFAPDQATTPICNAYLKDYRDKPRTFNLHRSVLRQVLAFAALEGLREGFNPIDNIPTKRTEARSRILTDEEIAALKDALLQAKRGGQAHVQMMEIALLTGQRISDVIKMRWQDVTEEGIRVKQKKTGAQLIIEWSPALRRVVDSCAVGTEKIGHLLKKSTGAPYRYAGIRSAWVRACTRAGIEDLNIHDMRGRAGADRKAEAGIEAAQDLLGHESVTMTEKYVKGKAARRAKATGGD
ncbi:MAG: tyrosine-type recombinase/integrase [Burkholderiales bacterium]|nr:tyrosine-type recombinase/integrase [Burkholderiales bacterium]